MSWIWACGRVRRWPISLGPGQIYLMIAYLAYFSYFAIVGSVTGGVAQAFQAMSPVLPIVIFAALAVIVPKRAIRLSYRNIGLVSTGTVLATTALALGETLINGCERVALGAGNPLPMATLLLSLTYCCALGWDQKSKQQRRLGLVAIILGLFTIMYLSGSRGPSLAALIMIPLLLWLVRLSFLRSLGLVAGIVSSVFLLGAVKDVACGDGLATVQNYLIAFETVSKLDVFPPEITGEQAQGAADAAVPTGQSTAQRLDMLSAGTKAFLASPVFGYGPQNRFDAAIAYLGDKSMRYSHLHNTFLTHAVAGGVIGLGLLLAIILSPLVLLGLYAPVSRNDVYFALTLSATAVLTGMTNLLLFHDILSSYFAFAPIVLLTMMEAQKNVGVRVPRRGE